MQQKILITCFEKNDDKDVIEFVKRIIEADIKDKLAIGVAAPSGSLLSDLAANNGVAFYHIDLPGEKSLPGRIWCGFNHAKEIHQDFPFRVVHTNTLLEQLVFCLWKFITGNPVMVIRTRFAYEAITNNLLNRFVHNKLTALNILFDNATEESFREKRPKDLLFLDNPCVLNDTPALTGRGTKMLEHCYLSMTTPTRDHVVSGNVADWSHISLTYITHFYINQESPGAIFNLLRRYEKYDPSVLDRIHFVIVDDGSPTAYQIPSFTLNLTWLKIREDIPWNQGGARNLGVVYGRSDNILMTDVDYEFPESTLRAMIDAPPCGRNIYKIYRGDRITGELMEGHANTFFMSRSRFFRFGGYDEEFSGHYGAEDYRFIKFQKAQGARQRYFRPPSVCYRRNDIDRKKEYHDLDRDLSYNSPVDARKKFELEYFGHGSGHSRHFLNFTWTRLAENRREVDTERRTDQMWKRLWYWRWLVGTK
jgi:hypothetical protein